MQLDVALNRRDEVMRIKFVFRVTRAPQVFASPTPGHGFDGGVATNSGSDIKLAHTAASVLRLKEWKLVVLAGSAALDQAVKPVANFKHVTLDMFEEPFSLPAGSEPYRCLGRGVGKNDPLLDFLWR